MVKAAWNKAGWFGAGWFGAGWFGAWGPRGFVPGLLLWMCGVVAAGAMPLAHPEATHPVFRLWQRDPLLLHSASALVIDARDQRVLFEKNPYTVRPIASLTKLMMAMVVLDAHQPMNQVITIRRSDIDTLKWSASRLLPGMRFTRARLLQLALMSSENRAAHALARHYPGGVAACVRAMNRKAHSLGMLDTHYVDPTGLWPGNRSNAHDIALAVEAAARYATIHDDTTDVGTVVHPEGRTLVYRNSDHLLYAGDWRMLVSKTGFINESGHCLAFEAVLRGRPVVVVLLDSWRPYNDFVDAMQLRDWLREQSPVQWALAREGAPLLH